MNARGRPSWFAYSILAATYSSTASFTIHSSTCRHTVKSWSGRLINIDQRKQNFVSKWRTLSSPSLLPYERMNTVAMLQSGGEYTGMASFAFNGTCDSKQAIPTPIDERVVGRTATWEELQHESSCPIANEVHAGKTVEALHSQQSRNLLTVSRRKALAQAGAAALVVTSPPPLAAWGKSELDSKSGQLFVPKSTMLGGGGSDETRGKSILKRNVREGDEKRKFQRLSGEPIQSIYETRFIAYLSRFLLTFDPAARSWWEENLPKDATTQKLRFAEFAESVEIGLTDYFLGPYGSYASVQAAKAGLNARVPAASSTAVQKSPIDILCGVWNSLNPKGRAGGMTSFMETKKKKKNALTVEEAGKQGIRNLLALLKARYTSFDAKLQLAILFPTEEISALLGEADNASIGSLVLKSPVGGYPREPKPDVVIDPPPALGDEYNAAAAEALLRPTSRTLSIKVVDGGEGYTSAPKVSLSAPKGRKGRQAEAVALLDREGHVDSVVVLDPGYGYENTPTVTIAAPQSQKGENQAPKGERRKAAAVSELEFEVFALNMTNQGSGYVYTQPPGCVVVPPKDYVDWSVLNDFDTDNIYKAKVAQMAAKLPLKADAVDTQTLEKIAADPKALLPTSVRPQFGHSLEFRPGLVVKRGVQDTYFVPGLPEIPPKLDLPSQLTALDPVFGGVGVRPVTKGAMSLSVGQYSRLALSGAICTVLVRTLLNPLELVKTKIQLGNDEELMTFATRSMTPQPPNNRSKASPISGFSDAIGSEQRGLGNVFGSRSTSKEANYVSPDGGVALIQESEIAMPQADTKLFADYDATEVSSLPASDESKLGTISTIRSMVGLRGPLALFQSADITFLASLVFGSLGFGATELFRRSFTMAFFDEGTSSGGGYSELILLVAAAVACVITSAAAAPFEMIRVKSMGLVEPKGWTAVLSDFLEENRIKRGKVQPGSASNMYFCEEATSTGIGLLDIRPDDLPPLWTAFYPIVSRELPFAITKFLAFDLLAKAILNLVNSDSVAVPVQVGVGPKGLAISAIAGAFAGIIGAFVSHPADLILTLTSAASKKEGNADSYDGKEGDIKRQESIDGGAEQDSEDSKDWRPIVKELLSKEGGVANLFLGLPARGAFFFLVIGLQFFLYDFVKNIFAVGADDLSLVLDVFYAVRQGL